MIKVNAPEPKRTTITLLPPQIAQAHPRRNAAPRGRPSGPAEEPSPRMRAGSRAEVV